MTSKTQETMKCNHEFIDLFHREFCSKCKKFKSDLQPEAQPQQEVPKEIKSKIWTKASKVMGTIPGRYGYIQGSEDMYHEMFQQLSTLTAENAKLKEELGGSRNDSRILLVQLDFEKESVSILEKEKAKLKEEVKILDQENETMDDYLGKLEARNYQENDKLWKALEEQFKYHLQFVSESSVSCDEMDGYLEHQWQQFKSNLLAK